MNISSTIKSIQDIMRKDDGVDPQSVAGEIGLLTSKTKKEKRNHKSKQVNF